MGRLIDADALIDMLLTENQKCITSTGHELTMNMIVSFINHQPIVFDKVLVEDMKTQIGASGEHMDNKLREWIKRLEKKGEQL